MMEERSEDTIKLEEIITRAKELTEKHERDLTRGMMYGIANAQLKIVEFAEEIAKLKV